MKKILVTIGSVQHVLNLDRIIYYFPLGSTGVLFKMASNEDVTADDAVGDIDLQTGSAVLQVDMDGNPSFRLNAFHIQGYYPQTIDEVNYVSLKLSNGEELNSTSSLSAITTGTNPPA